MLLRFYKSLKRTHIEYASAVWDPHHVKDIKLVEDVQKFALRVRSKTWNTNYETLLRSYNLTALSERRKLLKLCLLYNILADKVIFPTHHLRDLSCTILIGTQTASNFQFHSPRPSTFNILFSINHCYV